MTPGWPFLVGAVPIVAFTVLFGLAGPDTARAWLPAYPWLTLHITHGSDIDSLRMIPIDGNELHRLFNPADHNRVQTDGHPTSIYETYQLVSLYPNSKCLWTHTH